MNKRFTSIYIYLVIIFILIINLYSYFIKQYQYRNSINNIKIQKITIVPNKESANVTSLTEDISIEPPIIEKYNKTLYVKTDVNIREKPDVNSKIYSIATKNSSIIEVDRKNGWSIIKKDNKYLYINSLYLSENAEMPAKESHTEAAAPQQNKYLGNYKITAYCGCSKCCGKSDCITASGTKATQGRTVAAPKTLPFGTKLNIGGKIYTVEDRGGAIKGNRIDVYFNSHSEALKFGVKYLDVYIQ